MVPCPQRSTTLLAQAWTSQPSSPRPQMPVWSPPSRPRVPLSLLWGKLRFLLGQEPLLAGYHGPPNFPQTRRPHFASTLNFAN